MKHQKKYPVIIISLLLILLITVSALSVSAKSTVNAYANATHSPAEATEKSGSLGMHVYINAPFSGVAFAMPTWSVSGQYSAELSVYTWSETYEATVKAEPVATKLFEKLQDNATNWLKFDTLDAGEYYIAIHNTTGQVGCWTVQPDVKVSKGYMMIDGSENSSMEMEMFIEFEGAAPTEPFKQVESIADKYGEAPVYEPITEDQMNLSGYNLPSDSLYVKNDVMPDTWVFTDGLGRVSLGNADVGDPRDDKTLALFYWTWHASMGASSAFNVQEALDKAESEGVDISVAKNDYNNPMWPGSGYQHFWNEPLWGYYKTDDEWVLRRQSEMLANALVDTVFTDNTNGQNTWKNSYLCVYETWTKAQQDGVNTPKISFMLPFSASEDSKAQLNMLYLDIYRPGKYQSLWFRWDSKPMLMAYQQNLSINNGLDKEIKSFFTFRNNYAGYINESPALKQWGWLSVYPQSVYYSTSSDKKAGIAEQISVGVSQNHNFVTHLLSAMNGENTTDRTYTSTGYDTRENAKLYGANFAEQFNYALEIDPKVIFVTGWNEWIAGRYDVWGGVQNAFPDEYNDVASRDIEPSRGDLKDHYYYQFVNFVRQYKGVRTIPTPTFEKTVDINAGTDVWADVAPYYAAYIGNTGDRDAKGYKNIYYTEFSGRNDIIGAQLARDNDYIYLNIECADNITPYTDKLWMNIYLDTDADNQGFETFDYVINKTSPKDEHTAYLEKFTGNNYETEGKVEVSYTVDGRYLRVAVKKSDLGISGKDYTVNFSVTDNVHDRADEGQKQEDGSYIYSTFSGDILDFYTSGDVAPGGRFKYSFISTAANSTEAGEETTGDETTPDETTVDETTSEETTAEETTTYGTTDGTEDITTAQTTKPDVTTAETAQSQADTTAAETEGGKKSGCGGTISGVMACLTLLTGAGLTLIRKKAKNNNSNK